ncbi:hypothetical protein BGHDH14_bgh04419 [Blumeria hordei DH14]|uniref:Senescence domain-containing protein n=1 Tax=Blumeria graminis f. sp. hordei (strain DH14) TaxID=546991 RepID=N1JAG7_BLUG1|nr:hypothetical protein BGHDH14_bgh04419 [Blumeria hordei DH14]
MAKNPKLLYAIEGVKAYQSENNVERTLTPTGPQTLSLLMVPTLTATGDHSTSGVSSEASHVDDCYLHINLPPTLDITLPATTQVYRDPPHSYLIRRRDLGPECNSLIRLEFPNASQSKDVQGDIDTFESILAQCTAFLEHINSPRCVENPIDSLPPPPYQQNEFGLPANGTSSGKIVIVDEENGNIVGELGTDYHVVEDVHMKPGSKDPVEITLPTDGSDKIKVSPASSSYLEMARHPAYQNSTLVSKAALASQLIVTTSDYVSKTLQSQADSYTQKTKPTAKPITFQPTTHARIRKIFSISEGAADLSSKTVGHVQRYAQNFGATMVKNDRAHNKTGLDSQGKAGETYKPGLINKSMMAFSTIADGIDQASRNLLSGTSTAATTFLSHKYGPEAGEITKHIGAGAKNVGLVYIDVAGVSRRAIIKSVAKGMVIGKVQGGGNLVVNGEGISQPNQPSTSPGTTPNMPKPKWK